MIKIQTLSFVKGGAIPTQFQYDESRPLEVRMIFDPLAMYHGPQAVAWTFARTILFDGLVQESGGGDVTIQPGPEEGHVSVHLDSPEGQVDLILSGDDVADFLDRTYGVVSEEDEESIIADALEAWVATFYSKGDNSNES